MQILIGFLIIYRYLLGLLSNFFIKIVKSNAVFFGALITQIIICLIYYFGIFSLEQQGEAPVISYLWLNFLGAVLVTYISLLLEFKNTNTATRIVLMLITVGIGKVIFDIFNGHSLNIYHVVYLIIMFISIGLFNKAKEEAVLEG